MTCLIDANFRIDGDFLTHTYEILRALLPVVGDLSRDLPDDSRYGRLLDALRQLVSCDAVALLKLVDATALVPLATHGLAPDTLGRRFEVEDHPRLAAILGAERTCHFPPGCELPDPYDGLVDAAPGPMAVHDCMGCALRVGGQVWGVLTADALAADSFTSADEAALDTFSGFAAATVAASMRFRTLTQAAEVQRRRAEAYRLSMAPPARDLIGRSPAFKGLMAEIDLVAESDLTVLITGETGVGKELVAQQLHARSRRAQQALVSVNCAALPESLVESELFGHVRGAFSGAVHDRSGKFEVAHRGTLFLDEIGELPLGAQAKLLRVLQNGQLQRVGSDSEMHTDVRLIAATNRDLAEAVKAGRFRADLYHRLSVYPMHVPPLRERGRDVLLLAGFFLEENRRRMGLRGLRLAEEAREALLGHPWPGNVRELEYLIARASLKARGRRDSGDSPKGEVADIITVSSVDLDLERAPALAPTEQGSDPEQVRQAPSSLRLAVEQYERQLITHALMRHDGNVAASARELDMDRANLIRLAGRLGVAVNRRKPRARQLT